MIQQGLPEELVDEIISYFKEDCDTLKACSLTCKALNDFMRPYLYRKIVIYHDWHPGQPKDLPILDYADYRPAYTTHLTITSSLLRLEIDDPNSLVQELPLDRFTHVHTLTLSQMTLPRFSAALLITNFTRRITSLRLHDLPGEAASALYIILGFPSLRCLAIHPNDQSPNTSGSLSGDEVGSKEHLPPLDCLHFRLDINPHLALALMLSPIQAKETKRLQLVTSFSKSECFAFGAIVEEVVSSLEVLVMSLKPTEETRFHVYVVFQLTHSTTPGPFRHLHTLTLSDLDFSTPHKVVAHYVLSSLIFHNLAYSPDKPLKRITLSFSPQTTSRDDIMRSMSTIHPGSRTELSQVVAPHLIQGGDAIFKNIWELLDSRLGDSVSFPNLKEVVVQIRASTRADSDEMKLDDLEGFVAGLLPLCKLSGLLKVEMDLLELECGLWEMHKFE